MAFSGHYPRTSMLEHSSQSYSTSYDSIHDYIDPELELWDSSSGDWMETKQPMHRFLTEQDQGPTLFHTANVQDGQGACPLSGPYQQDSPRETTLSSIESCASPPCETDFPQPQSPATSDCTSPSLGFSTNAPADVPQAYMSLAHVGPVFAGIDYHLDDPAGFFGNMETSPGWSSGGYCSALVQSPWQSGPQHATRTKAQVDHVPIHSAIHLSTTHTTHDSIPTEDCLVVNTETHGDSSSRSKRSSYTQFPTSTPQTKVQVRASKRKGSTDARPAKRPRIKATGQTGLPALGSARPSTKNIYSCNECTKPASFKDEQSLLKHRKVQHTRPFTCVYCFAGCTSTFASKNEWKRHVLSQHIVLKFWVCSEGSCGPVSTGSFTTSSSRPEEPKYATTSGHGTIFNRKDLYTQHLRRMHVPPEFKEQMSEKNANVAEWEKKVKEHQRQAQRIRCALPDHMVCPVPACTASFEGANAWDDRMEHVARHLDPSGDNGQGATADGPDHAEPFPADFGGPGDEILLEWSTRPDVDVIRWNQAAGGWQLNSPLRTSAGPRKSSSVHGAAAAPGRKIQWTSTAAAEPRRQHHHDAYLLLDQDDEDAEGEEDDGYVF
ncbi:PR domain zinc finger protein 5 [Microdochium nivale]|nr:PR domain zinc finger protein 5 [Microdochium nivale]